MYCPKMLTILVLELIHFGSALVIQQSFKQIGFGYLAVGENNATDAKTAGNYKECAAYCQTVGTECRGFDFTLDSMDQPTGSCQLKTFMHTRKFNFNLEHNPLFSAFVSSSVQCIATSDCKGPFNPTCSDNTCVINCEPHQIESEDGNCSMAITNNHPSSYPHKALRWFIVSGVPEGVMLDPTCTSEDKCTIIISMEKPPSMYYNYWPEEFNFWPETQVRITLTNDEIQVTSLQVSQSNSIVSTTELSSDILNVAGLSNHTFTISVSDLSSGNREVTVSYLDQGTGNYNPIGNPTLIPTSSDGDFYMTTANAPNSRIMTTYGPVYMKGIISWFGTDTECVGDDIKVRTHTTYAYMCAPTYPIEAHQTDDKIYWYQMRYGSFTMEFQVQTMHDEGFEVVLADPADAYNWRSTSKPDERYTVQFRKQNSNLRLRFFGGMACKTESPPGCDDSILLLGQSEWITTDLFSGNWKDVKIVYSVASVKNSTTCAFKPTLNLDGYTATISVTIDGVPASTATKQTDARCYKTYKNDRTIMNVDKSIHSYIGVMGVRFPTEGRFKTSDLVKKVLVKT